MLNLIRLLNLGLGSAFWEAMDQNTEAIEAEINTQNERIDTLDSWVNPTIAGSDAVHVLATTNVVNPEKIQLAVAFDLNDVYASLVPNTDVFDFTCMVESEGTNIASIDSQFYFNNSAVVGTTANSIRVGTGTAEDFALARQKYLRRATIPTNSYRYLHCFVDLILEDNTKPAEFWLSQFKLYVKGKEMLKLSGAKLYQKNTTDLIENVDYTPNQLVTIAYLQQNNVASLKYFGKIMNVLGDSITGNPIYTTKFYHDYLKEMFGLSLVRNYGIGGSTVAKLADDTNNSMALRYTEMDNDADIILVFGGTNDSYENRIPIGTMADRTVETYYGAWHVLLSGLIEKYPEKTIVAITPLQRDTAEIVNYIQPVKDVAAYYSIPCLDLYNGGGLYAGSETIRNKYMPDGLHPNAEGHRIIADKMAGFLLGSGSGASSSMDGGTF